MFKTLSVYIYYFTLNLLKIRNYDIKLNICINVNFCFFFYLTDVNDQLPLLLTPLMFILEKLQLCTFVLQFVTRV